MTQASVMTFGITRRREWMFVVVLVSLLATPSAAQETESEQEKSERVADVLSELCVRDGAHIADIGSAEGFYTLRIARAVAPSGRAYAVDIAEKPLQKLRERATKGGVGNIEPILGEVTDPKLPTGTLDAVLIRNAYHEMTEHRAVLKAAMTALKPGGVLVVIEGIHDNIRSLPRDGQIKEHEIASDIVEAELKEAGFQIIKKDDQFTKFTRPPSGGFWLITARRPPP